MPAVLVEDLASADQSAPVGPSPEEEAAFLSTEGGGGGVRAPVAIAANAEDEKGELPPMEDLFRARFVTVKRMPKTAMKNE